MLRSLFLLVLMLFVGSAPPRASSVLDLAADGVGLECAVPVQPVQSAMVTTNAVGDPAAEEVEDEEEEAATFSDAGRRPRWACPRHSTGRTTVADQVRVPTDRPSRPHA